MSTILIVVRCKKLRVIYTELYYKYKAYNKKAYCNKSKTVCFFVYIFIMFLVNNINWFSIIESN